MNEWANWARMPINVSLITLDLLYMRKRCPLCLELVETSGVKVGLLGIIIILMKKEKH